MAVLTLPHCFPLQSVNGRSKSELKQSNSGGRRWCTVASQQQELCTQSERIRIDKSVLKLEEACSEAELWATSLLRVRSFYNFKSSFGIEDHKKYLAEYEFEALKERLAGTKEGQKVSCINATLPISETRNFPDELCSSCKFSDNGEDRVVVGTLDLNQCMSLPNEITGMKPKGIGGDFARGYLSNVCVAKECQRNGLGLLLVENSKSVAEDWDSYMNSSRVFYETTQRIIWCFAVKAANVDQMNGISDLYVHVAVDNDAARNLYTKCGFIYESEEPAWQARFLDRPRRHLLWIGIPIPTITTGNFKS